MFCGISPPYSTQADIVSTNAIALANFLAGSEWRSDTLRNISDLVLSEQPFVDFKILYDRNTKLMASFLLFLVGEPTNCGDVNLSTPRAQESLLSFKAETASFCDDSSDNDFKDEDDDSDSLL